MEIEIKAKCRNPEAVRKRLGELGAKFLKHSHQIDEYYNHPQKDLLKEPEYIRLRYMPGRDEGVFAYHINVAVGATKEKEVETKKLSVFKEILGLLGLKMIGTINKKREEYALEEYLITIDEVKDIDTFAEVETDGGEREIEEKKKACKDLLLKLGIQPKDICENVWLSDIATGKMKYNKNEEY